MKAKMIYLGIILLVAFSLCISETPQNPEKTETMQKEITTQTPEATETPSTTSPATPPTTPASTPSAPAKREVLLNEEKTQNNIIIKIIKLYYVNEPKYGSSGTLEDHLRLDLSITNNKDSTIEFYPNITSIIEDDLKNQYVVLSMPSSKNWGKIKPGETKEGYIVFPKLDENAKSIRIVLRNDTTVIEFTIDTQNL